MAVDWKKIIAGIDKMVEKEKRHLKFLEDKNSNSDEEFKVLMDERIETTKTRIDYLSRKLKSYKKYYKELKTKPDED